MKAVMLHEPEKLELVELPDPSPGAGEVLLRIEACSICGSDLEGYHGIHPKMTYPRVMGHEYAGTVTQVGEGVTKVQVGDRVASVGNVPCGDCGPCKEGNRTQCSNRRGPGFTAHGAYAEYLVVPGESCFVLPDEMSFPEAAVAQPFSIAYHASAVRARAGEGDTILVQGCGPIGLGAMMIAKARGATVFSSDVVDYRLDLARELGVDRTFNAHTDNIAEIVVEITRGRMLDKVIECVGGDQDETLPEAVKCIRPGGLVVVVGSFAADRATVPIIDFKFNEKRIIGSQSMPEGYGPAVELLVAGEIQAKPLITHTVSLEEVEHALKLMDRKEGGIVKAVVTPSR